MTEKDNRNGTVDDEGPSGEDEVPWRLEDEDREDTQGARFEPDDIPDEETESRGAVTRLKMGALAAAIALLAAALVGAAVVDDGVAGVELEQRQDGAEDARSANDTASEAEANENGIIALPLEAGATGGDQLLRLRNIGDGIKTSNLRIEVVLLNHGSSATVTDLPADRLELGKHIEGDDIFDRSYAGVGGAASEDTWHGDELALRIKHGDGGAELEPGDAVRVKVFVRGSESGSGSETSSAPWNAVYRGTLEAR